ncbi:MAG: alcohol dehydrogenase [Deltaproteobacteria bacterium RIFOXYD12_FULL_50_9]|nr:MAG: alcohol dehydrogenase [Deltaproteobacteria bacterium RIFOXYD12_FULL_50_9]
MRVAMYYNNRDVRLEEHPTPAIGPGELLIRIQAGGICGSDVMEWYRIHKAPLILGHEIAGEIAAIGQGVTGFAIGDRVCATHHVPCFSCHYCYNGHETVCDTLLSGTHFDPGGFCEFVRLPAINVRHGTWKLPEEVSFEQGTFVEPLACVLRGQRTARFAPGASVLVLGSGISGLLHIHLAAATGAGLVMATDLSAYRLRLARQFGADLTFPADAEVADLTSEATKGRGADLVIVCAGATSAFTQAMAAVARGGTILCFASTAAVATIPLSINDLFWRRDVTITTSYAGSPADCAMALELIKTRRVKVTDMITHRFGLADTGKGFSLVAQGGESMKVIIHPQE